jgi:hypothetical protein
VSIRGSIFLARLKAHHLLRFLLVGFAFTFCSCATNDHPPCRRVSAAEFMRPHTFKGIPTDEFIGVTRGTNRASTVQDDAKAFKTVWEMGLFHGWAVIWCPVNELPKDYLEKARENPNRKPAEAVPGRRH